MNVYILCTSKSSLTQIKFQSSMRVAYKQGHSRREQCVFCWRVRLQKCFYIGMNCKLFPTILPLGVRKSMYWVHTENCNDIVLQKVTRMALWLFVLLFLRTYIPAFVYFYVHTYIDTYIHTCIHACQCINTCIHTYIHVYIHNTYIHTHVRTYVDTYEPRHKYHHSYMRVLTWSYEHVYVCIKTYKYVCTCIHVFLFYIPWYMTQLHTRMCVCMFPTK